MRAWRKAQLELVRDQKRWYTQRTLSGFERLRDVTDGYIQRWHERRRDRRQHPDMVRMQNKRHQEGRAVRCRVLYVKLQRQPKIEAIPLQFCVQCHRLRVQRHRTEPLALETGLLSAALRDHSRVLQSKLGYPSRQGTCELRTA